VMAIGVASIVFVLLCIPVGSYTIWMNIRYSLAVPAAVVESVKARTAIRRSVELSKGARWRIFALLVLVVVIKIGLVGLTQSFVFVAAFRSHGQISMTVHVISQVIQFFTNSFLGPIGAAGLTLFYFDQRVRKEGYDIEWMMQAAGLVQAAGTTPTVELPAADSEKRPEDSALITQPAATVEAVGVTLAETPATATAGPLIDAQAGSVHE
jgi:Membrane domain of glycerophosphoryl diester phosphodiesterase